MRTILISGVAILLSTAAFPAAAVPAAGDAASQEGGQSSSQADSTSQPRQRARASDRQICVTEAMSTGRIRRRVCHTQAEWDRLQGSDDQ